MEGGGAHQGERKTKEVVEAMAQRRVLLVPPHLPVEAQVPLAHHACPEAGGGGEGGQGRGGGGQADLGEQAGRTQRFVLSTLASGWHPMQFNDMTRSEMEVV